MSSEGDTEGLTAYLMAGIHNLAAAGAEAGALACNTGHMVFDELQKASPIPMVSIVDVTCAEAVRQGYQSVCFAAVIIILYLKLSIGRSCSIV